MQPFVNSTTTKKQKTKKKNNNKKTLANPFTAIDAIWRSEFGQRFSVF